MPSCSRADCRTSLNDEATVWCAHGLPFCEFCAWEEACPDCNAAAVGARFDGLRAMPAAPMPTRDLEPPCRCGWRDVSPLGAPPVRVPIVTLANEQGLIALETSPARRTCRSCTHPIFPGSASVVHRLRAGAGVYNRYHPECVETS